VYCHDQSVTVSDKSKDDKTIELNQQQQEEIQSNIVINNENKVKETLTNNNKDTTTQTKEIINANKEDQKDKPKSHFIDPMNDKLKYRVISTNKKKQHQQALQQLKNQDSSTNTPTTTTTTTDTDTSSTTTNNNIQYETINMSTKDGVKYTCKIPVRVEQPKIEWKPIPSVDEIKDSIKMPQCISKLIGWWTYEFCPTSYVKQMRIEKQQNLNEYYLGYYIKDKLQQAIKGIDKRQMQIYSSNGPFELTSTPYYSETFVDGTPCDIINVHRQTEVRYYCSEDKIKGTYISEVLEPTSCSYVLKIYTPDMCNHPIFRPRQDKIMDIECTTITQPTTTSTTNVNTK